MILQVYTFAKIDLIIIYKILKMSSCNGIGECLTQCSCECFNEETDTYNEVCVCGHREHNGYF